MTDPWSRESASCAEIRVLMLAEEERPLSDFEARRIEQHIEACAHCLRILEGRSGSDAARQRLVLRHLEEPASDAEWARVTRGLHRALGWEDSGAQGAPAPLRGAAAPPASGARERLWWRPLAPLAATLLLSLVVILEVARQRQAAAPGEGEIAVEVIELPPGTQSMIVSPERDEDGILVYITSGAG